ncbi:MAG: alpha-glucuronidase family glycosyl hydrolase [Planctomycetota bacterium]
MKRSLFMFLILWLLAPSCCWSQAPKHDALVNIVISPKAAPPEKIAADELSHYLGRLYPGTRFEVADINPRGADHLIYLGCAKSFPLLTDRAGGEDFTGPESYKVTTARIDSRNVAIIFGKDPRGVMYGVYNLLEKLGCGFYLSTDTIPAKGKDDFSFDGWELSDAPLVRDRIVFNWHNFLSGCSTWNLSDWKSWITHAQKMGYNGVMVHAYGNNPMVKFSFNGMDKPVGYLSTTQKGRDWSTQHVNDVRRLWGGFVFDGPVFGCEAAIVPDENRADAAERLMHNVFAHAEQRDMDVYFAVDVDTASANPQAVIRTLPQEARFPIAVQQMSWMNQEEGKAWLANPDTPAGYLYYKAQVEALLKAYPQIDCLVVWFRHDNTPWMAFKAAEMPDSWQKEYDDELKKTPEAAKLWKSHNFFALAKIVKAFERAITEVGRNDIRIAIGSWRFDFLPGCDRFMPRHVKFIPLDWEVLNDRSRLRNSESRQVIREVGTHRPVLPVVWAHHDDGNYVGRPYTPYSDFHTRLVDSKACGFGVIHWTTRPLDLYFKSLSRQVWRNTEDQPLRATCGEMAERLFGAGARDRMAEYLHGWVTEAPKIGRETSDRFIDRKLGDMDEVRTGYERRMKLLSEVNESALEQEERNRLDYFKGLEQFVLDVHLAENALQQSRELYEAGDVAGARDAVAQCRPESVIEKYAEFSSLGGITRGEQGLVASMNLRWLTHYVRHRQMLGGEPVRYNFAPTSHDPLAQSMGTFTFHFGPDKRVWECFGTKETGAAMFAVPENVNISRNADVPAAYEEICRNGIESDKPITIRLQPIMAKGGRGSVNLGRLPAGKYRLELLMLDPESTGPGRRLFNVTVSNPEASLTTDEIDIFRQTGRANRILVRTYRVKLEEPGTVDVTIEPVKSKALLCGAVLEPVDDDL